MLLILCLLLLSGCGQWNIFKWAHKEGTAASSDTTVLVADGQALLDKGDYAKAVEVFEKAMNANPKSSEANYGYARAVIAASGLGLADLISSIIQQAKSPNPAPLPTGNPFINFVSPQYASGATATDKLLDPSKIKLDKLYDASKKAVTPLQRIADGLTDAVIPADDFDVNFNLAFLLVIRGVCNVLDTDGDNYIVNDIDDIISVNSNFELADGEGKSIFDPETGELTEAFKSKLRQYEKFKGDIEEQIRKAIDDVTLAIVETSAKRAGGYLGVALDKIDPEAAQELRNNSAKFKENLGKAKEEIKKFFSSI